MPDGSYKPACRGTLKKEEGQWSRVITSAHLSRPEDYYSIYQSGCNHHCLKCHSWSFSQTVHGFWASTDDLARMASDYELTVTVWEPRERATMWHATDLCRHCGLCATRGVRGPLCPGRLGREQIVLGPQGWGPARNIIAFTGGDIGCQPEFYAQATEKIKAACSGRMWVLFETNGYGLTPENLDLLASSGLDSFWLDIKAYHEETYRKLCGVTNRWILETPEWIVDRGFVLEALSLYIPDWVETDQIVNIAQLLHDVDPEIPFTILAIFPSYKLMDNRGPTLMEMLQTYMAVKDVGLKNVKLGNCHVFTKTDDDWNLLINIAGKTAVG
ncbi:MAG: radical SAM protein [Candidatus Bathyarchaeia archaeon]